MALAGVAAANETIWSTGFVVSTDGSWTADEVEGSVLSSSDWSLTKADGGDLVSTTTNSAELRPNVNVGTDQGWSLDFTLTNNSAEAMTFNTLTFDTVIFAGNGGYQGYSTARDFKFTLTYGDNSLTTGNWTISGNNSSTPDNGVVTFNLESAITLDASEDVTFTFDVVKGNSNPGCFLGLKTISAVSVPEPTTATLSLLALAGLVARRRRK